MKTLIKVSSMALAMNGPPLIRPRPKPLMPLMRPAMYQRLHRALSVVYGFEVITVLKDIWSLPDREVQRIAMWMADALIDAALRDAASRTSQPTAKRQDKARRRRPLPKGPSRA